MPPAMITIREKIKKALDAPMPVLISVASWGAVVSAAQTAMAQLHSSSRHRNREKMRFMTLPPQSDSHIINKVRQDVKKNANWNLSFC